MRYQPLTWLRPALGRVFDCTTSKNRMGILSEVAEVNIPGEGARNHVKASRLLPPL
jgi:hypothetical protein